MGGIGVQSHWLRVMTYSQDGFGLGHMRRTNSIARQLFQARPDAGILTLSDSPLGQLFATEKNHDFLKLPSIFKAGPGDWRAVNLPMDFEEVLMMRQRIVRSTLLCFEPHVLLVDHMPHGAMGELIPTLRAIKEFRMGTRVFLGLRDILDAPEVIEGRWRTEGAYDAMEEFYDQVLIYGMRDVHNVAEQYHFQPEVLKKIHYCGYVCTPVTARYVSRARTQSLANTREGTRMILVMAGGGADAFPMMSAVLDALPLVLSHRPCVVVMVTGPFMPAEQRHKLEMRSRGLPVRVRNTVSDVLSYLEATDLVISMAGYNSTVEILRSGKPAILIPRVGPSAEQRTRARLFASRNWVQYLDLSESDPDRLAQTIVLNLDARPGKERGIDTKPNLEGARAAVDQLLSSLTPELVRQEICQLITQV
jgi:predicted glycosyltransferase